MDVFVPKKKTRRFLRRGRDSLDQAELASMPGSTGEGILGGSGKMNALATSGSPPEDRSTSDEQRDIGSLLVLVSEVKSLPERLKGAAEQNLYCTATLNGMLQRTKVVKRGAQNHVEWDEELRFFVPERLDDKSLRIQCCAGDYGQNKVVGTGFVHLGEVLEKWETKGWITLFSEEVHQSEVYLELTFSLEEGLSVKTEKQALPDLSDSYGSTSQPSISYMATSLRAFEPCFLSTEKSARGWKLTSEFKGIPLAPLSSRPLGHESAHVPAFKSPIFGPNGNGRPLSPQENRTASGEEVVNVHVTNRQGGKVAIDGQRTSAVGEAPTQQSASYLRGSLEPLDIPQASGSILSHHNSRAANLASRLSFSNISSASNSRTVTEQRYKDAVESVNSYWPNQSLEKWEADNIATRSLHDLPKSSNARQITATTDTDLIGQARRLDTSVGQGKKPSNSPYIRRLPRLPVPHTASDIRLPNRLVTPRPASLVLSPADRPPAYDYDVAGSRVFEEDKKEKWFLDHDVRAAVLVDEPDDSDIKDSTLLRDFLPEMNKDTAAGVWTDYVDFADKYDNDMLAGWGETVNVFLVFTGLFSAVLTAFLLAGYPALQPDSGQATVDGLIIVSGQLAALISGQLRDSNTTAFQQGPFSPPMWAIYANCLWFFSLIITVLTAVLAMLIKEWLIVYSKDLPSSPLERARQRQFRYAGAIKWKVPVIVNSLPLFIHLAVFLFLGGLVASVSSISFILSMLNAVLLAIGACCYVVCAILPLMFGNCPYWSPLTTAAGLFATYIKAVLEIFVRCWRVTAIVNGVPPPDRTSPYSGDTDNPSLRSPWKDNINVKEAIDCEALGWLASTCQDQTVREAALLASVGLNPSGKTWNVVQNSIGNAARSAIALRLANSLRLENPGLEIQARMLHLGAFASLVTPGDFDVALHFRALQAVTTSLPWNRTSLTTFVYLLYNKGGVTDDDLMAYKEGHGLIRSALSWVREAVRDGQPVSLSGLCLFLGFLQRYGLWDAATDALWIVRPILASCTNIPSEYLSSLYSLLIAVIDRFSVTLQTDTSQRFNYHHDNAQLIIKFLQRLGNGPVQPLSLNLILAYLQSTLLFLSNNPTTVVDVNGKVINILCGQLLSEDAHIMKTIGEAAIPEERIEKLTLKAVVALMPGSDADLSASAAAEFFLRVEAQDFAFMLAWERARGALRYSPELVKRKVLAQLVRRIEHSDEAALCLPTVEIAQTCILCKAGGQIFDSGWLTMMQRFGLEYLMQWGHAWVISEAQRVMESLIRLGYEDAVMTSGIVDKLHNLFVETGEGRLSPFLRIRLRAWDLAKRVAEVHVRISEVEADHVGAEDEITTQGLRSPPLLS